MKKRDFYSIDKWKWFLYLALLVAIIPLLIIANYNHSVADDWGYSVKIHDVILMEGLHPILAIKSLCAQIKYFWQAWQGTYAAILLFQLQPAIWGEEFYRFGTYILSFCVIFATFYFFRSLFLRVLSIQKNVADITSTIVLLMWFELMPTPVQGLYWWNGASYYVIFCALMLCLCGALFKMQQDKTCSWIKFLGLLLLVFFIAGGNFVTALLTAEILFLNAVVAFINKSKFRWQSFVLFVVHLAGFMFSALAPGNAVRQTEYEQFPAGKAIVYSFSEAYFFIEEYTSIYVILALLFLIPFLWKNTSSNRIISKIPYGVLVMFAYSFFASSFTPNLYAYGETGPGRIQNIRYWIMLILYVILLAVAVNKVKQQLCKIAETDFAKEKDNTYISRTAVIFLCNILLLLTIFTISCCRDEYKDTLSTISAIHSLSNGEAHAYDAEWDARIDELLNSSKQNLVFERIKNKPHLLYFCDIYADKDGWRNHQCAQYYKKESVRVKKKKSTESK